MRLGLNALALLGQPVVIRGRGYDSAPSFLGDSAAPSSYLKWLRFTYRCLILISLGEMQGFLQMCFKHFLWGQ